MESLPELLAAIRSCHLCAPRLPQGPRPVFRITETARLLIVGQAPGIKVHKTGIPWNDPSGDRLRQWLQIDRSTFYDDTRIAIIPMGYCYPGRAPRGGDLPPRPECAPTWLPRLKPFLQNIQITLLVGAYAQRYYLGERTQTTLTETVRAWRCYAPEYIPLPHPSFRNNHWLQQNPWFETDLLPVLRQHVHRLIIP